jgi:non-heme chloroperoxidase
MTMIESRDGTLIHVKQMGSGRPVVLIHGWPLTGDMWEYQTVALVEAGFHVITYDRRGFGHSAHPARGYTYDNFADDLAAVIDECTPDGAAVVGFSMGGGEVARYLSRHGSSKISRAALVGSVVPYMLKTDDHPDGVDSSMFDDIKAQIRKDRFAFLQTFAKQFYGIGMVSSPVSQGIVDWTFALAIMGSPLATIACVDAFGTTDFRPDLGSFEGVPTLIIHGTSDQTVPIDATGRAAANGIPHARFIEYEGEPHGLFATVPDRLNQDLVAFLQ